MLTEQLCVAKTVSGRLAAVKPGLRPSPSPIIVVLLTVSMLISVAVSSRLFDLFSVKCFFVISVYVIQYISGVFVGCVPVLWLHFGIYFNLGDLKSSD